MPYFTVTYEYTASAADLDAVRPAHLSYLRGLDELRLSGPLVGGQAGALLMLEADDQARATEIVARDPFVTAGCVGARSVRQWNPVSGSLLTFI